MSPELRDLAARAAWTFVQAFAGVVAVTDHLDKAALAAAVAAGLSAVKTSIVQRRAA